MANHNVYTSNVHIGILDDETSVEVVGAHHELLKTVNTSFVKTTPYRCVTEIVSSVNGVFFFLNYVFFSPSEQISQM